MPDDAPESDFRHHRLGEPTAHWTYLDARGRVLGYVIRFDADNGRKEILPRTYCEGPEGRREWRWKGFPKPHPLYGLDRLAQRAGAPILVTEGEKAADKAAELFPDFVVITSPGGAKAAKKADWKPLAGREVFIWPDNDDEGRKYAEVVARLCIRVGATDVRIIEVPAVFLDKWDLADPAPEGWETDALRFLIKAADLFDLRPIEAIQQFNQIHAVVLVGNRCVVLDEYEDPTFGRHEVRFLNPTDFKACYSNRKIRVGGREISIGSYWLSHPKRRQYGGVVFAPDQETPGYYNLWRGLAVEPKPGDCQLYLDHIRNVISSGDEEVSEYIIAWM
ncbi:MAG: DUF6371 domain-containing protein, partial [Alphaproteobacteria bacterium]|nr:DUF6371 domain-containing protein [Alphaproteobacteria bacterium]